jgi:hypothetical protein
MNLVSLVSAVSGLFAGTVSLGGIDLAGMEVPEKLAWGGAQRATIHKLPGGGRVIDLMGQDDADIKWSGYFQGPQANSRARSIDAMRIAGAPVTLSWPGFTRQVIVSEFSCSSERGGYLLPYSVCCTVIPTVPVPGQPSLLGQIANDIGAAVGVPNLMQTITPVLAQAQSALAAVQKVMPIAGVLTGGSSAFVAVSGALATAQGSIGISLNTAQNAMGGIIAGATATGTPLGTLSPVAAVQNLGTALANATGIAGLLTMAGSVKRAVSNLTNAGA